MEERFKVSGLGLETSCTSQDQGGLNTHGYMGTGMGCFSLGKMFSFSLGKRDRDLFQKKQLENRLNGRTTVLKIIEGII